MATSTSTSSTSSVMLAPTPAPAPAATLSCACQTARILLAAPPVGRTICCCMDCRKGIQWCMQQQQQQQQHQTPLLFTDLVYVPNWLHVVSGKDSLNAYLIKEGYNTVRIVATCCWTPLLGDHPNYKAHKIVLYLPDQTLQMQLHPPHSNGLPPPTRCIFTNDLTPEELRGVPPLSAFCNDDNANVTVPNPPNLPQLQTEFPQYETVQSLIESLGPIQFMDPHYQGKPTIWNTINAATNNTQN